MLCRNCDKIAVLPTPECPSSTTRTWAEDRSLISTVCFLELVLVLVLVTQLMVRD